MADCNRQTRIGSGTEAAPKPINQEEFLINNEKKWGTLSDPELLPDMERHGYSDSIAYVLKIEATLFASQPAQQQDVIRCVNDEKFFGRMVETKDPVVFTFLLIDREP